EDDADVSVLPACAEGDAADVPCAAEEDSVPPLLPQPARMPAATAAARKSASLCFVFLLIDIFLLITLFKMHDRASSFQVEAPQGDPAAIFSPHVSKARLSVLLLLQKEISPGQQFFLLSGRDFNIQTDNA
ncbi:MAG TPA: hypothetical protein DEP61_09065, partial [Lachnospiraceae bacterium]|nr:hypothetical protein [Lachnospiraceae bacterium]